MNNTLTSITILPSHYHVLNIKKEKENQNKRHTAIKKLTKTGLTVEP